MRSDGYCDVCGCHWSDHTNSHNVYRQAQKTEYIDTEDLKL